MPMKVTEIVTRERSARSDSWGLPTTIEVEAHHTKHDDEALVLNALLPAPDQPLRQVALAFTRAQLAELMPEDVPGRPSVINVDGSLHLSQFIGDGSFGEDTFELSSGLDGSLIVNFTDGKYALGSKDFLRAAYTLHQLRKAPGDAVVDRPAPLTPEQREIAQLRDQLHAAGELVIETGRVEREVWSKKADDAAQEAAEATAQLRTWIDRDTKLKNKLFELRALLQDGASTAEETEDELNTLLREMWPEEYADD